MLNVLSNYVRLPVKKKTFIMNKPDTAFLVVAIPLHSPPIHPETRSITILSTCQRTIVIVHNWPSIYSIPKPHKPVWVDGAAALQSFCTRACQPNLGSGGSSNMRVQSVGFTCRYRESITAKNSDDDDHSKCYAGCDAPHCPTTIFEL